MKRYFIAILRSVESEGPDAAGATRQVTGRPRCGGGQTERRGLGRRGTPFEKTRAESGGDSARGVYAVGSTGRFRRTRRRSLHVLMEAPQAVPPRSRRFWTCTAPEPVDRHVRREDLERDGFVVVEDALDPDAVERLTAAVERVRRAASPNGYAAWTMPSSTSSTTRQCCRSSATPSAGTSTSTTAPRCPPADSGLAHRR